MKFLLVLFALAFFASANTEFFNIPDLAFITPRVYHVFPDAPNKNSKFDTITGAINQALCDGFTPDALPFRRANIVIMPGEYQGEGPDNEIVVPVSVSLNGHPNGASSFHSNVKITATLVFDNSGLLPGSVGLLDDISWHHTGLNIIQSNKDKPAVIYDNDLTAALQFLVFSECYLLNTFTDSTAPLIKISNFAATFMTDCYAIQSSSTQPVILAKDVSGFESFYCFFIAYRIIVSEGVGTLIPGTFMAFYHSEIFVLPPFLGGEIDSEIRLIEIQSAGTATVDIFLNVFSTLGTSNYTMGSIVYNAPNLTGPGECPRAIFQTNSYNMEQISGGPQFLYNAPGCPISSGNKAEGNSIIATNVGTLVASVDV